MESTLFFEILIMATAIIALGAIAVIGDRRRTRKEVAHHPRIGRTTKR